ncbi:unnamed protein product, partial [Mesorhabditis spiculigera]
MKNELKCEEDYEDMFITEENHGDLREVIRTLSSVLNTPRSEQLNPGMVHQEMRDALLERTWLEIGANNAPAPYTKASIELKSAGRPP